MGEEVGGVLYGLVLAGAPNTGKLREASEVAAEAIIPVGGKLLVDYVVEALAGVPEIQTVVVAGPAVHLRHLEGRERVEVVDATGALVDNLAAGLRRLPENELVVVATADVPLITAAGVAAFVAQCRELGEHDFYYTVVPKDAILDRYPDARRSWIAFRDQVVTGGNVFMLRPAAALTRLPLLKRVTDLRKSPLGLASMLGPVLIIKYLLHALTLGEAEKRVRAYFGIDGRAVVARWPEAGMDVDKPVDLRLVESVLAHR